jgi:hypothetical protein
MMVDARIEQHTVKAHDCKQKAAGAQIENDLHFNVLSVCAAP